MKMPAVKDLPLISELPDVFLFQDGSRVNNLAEWERRKGEIARLYQYYMYGYMPDTSGESISMEYIDFCKLASWGGGEIRNTAPDRKIIRLKIRKGERKGSFAISVSFPAEERNRWRVTDCPACLYRRRNIRFNSLGPLGEAQRGYLNSHGYVVIEFSNNEVAADDRSRTGTFYDLYPYGERPENRQVR